MQKWQIIAFSVDYLILYIISTFLKVLKDLRIFYTLIRFIGMLSPNFAAPYSAVYPAKK
jgi:hypothetical protein